jgi:hypothetical protein
MLTMQRIPASLKFGFIGFSIFITCLFLLAYSTRQFFWFTFLGFGNFMIMKQSGEPERIPALEPSSRLRQYAGVTAIVTAAVLFVIFTQAMPQQEVAKFLRKLMGSPSFMVPLWVFMQSVLVFGYAKRRDKWTYTTPSERP